MGTEQWEVWIGQECDLAIYNMSGETQGSLVWSGRLYRDFRSKPRRMTTTYRSPGSAAEKTRSVVIGHELQIRSDLYRGDAQITPFFSATQDYWIEVTRVNVDKPLLLQSETTVFKHCVPTDGPDDGARDNDISETTVGFNAETRTDA